jgi:hypothetical protein
MSMDRTMALTHKNTTYATMCRCLWDSGKTTMDTEHNCENSCMKILWKNLVQTNQGYHTLPGPVNGDSNQWVIQITGSGPIRGDTNQWAIQITGPGPIRGDSNQWVIQITGPGPIRGDSNQWVIQITGPGPINADLNQSRILISGSSPTTRFRPISNTNCSTWYYERRSRPTGDTTHRTWSYERRFRPLFCQLSCQITACYLHVTAPTSCMYPSIFCQYHQGLWTPGLTDRMSLKLNLKGQKQSGCLQEAGSADTWNITAGKMDISIRWWRNHILVTYGPWNNAVSTTDYIASNNVRPTDSELRMWNVFAVAWGTVLKFCLQKE